MQQVLFLCSGNYYRSRFAEHLFNWLASQADLPWRADSRGLIVGLANNVGPISAHTLHALKLRGIAIPGEPRHPLALTTSDLDHAGLVVAVKEAEHRRMMQEQFPDWSEKVQYWHVDDLDREGPEVALPLLEQKVRALASHLQQAMRTPPQPVGL